MEYAHGSADVDNGMHLAPHASPYGSRDAHGSSFQSPSEFRHPRMTSIDPSLESQTALYGSQRPITPSTPSNAVSPRYSHSPQTRPKAAFVPSDRSLPSRSVTDASLDDAYAAFILYCNPNFPASTDTSELRRLFRLPPKSDGKNFDTWVLWELIEKLDSGEIKTWTQLALDLGVEKPTIEKGQSTQKVQQYSVRLKRWMRAMHIDAFFEYLLSKPHSYFTHLPPSHAPYPPSGRDGVSLEEDLAIRALDPRFRPKRGRRKTEDQDDDNATVTFDPSPPLKRPRLDTSINFSQSGGGSAESQSAFPASAIPFSAHPDSHHYGNMHDAWPQSAIPASTTSTLNPHTKAPSGGIPHSATAATAPQQLRWKINADMPSTPHPLTAITPASAHPDSSFSHFNDEPQSAISMTPSSKTPSSGRRRRHGPAVSSAWPSTNNTPGGKGKLRGRPPSNRSVRDGPFSTFPANPRAGEGPMIDLANRSRSSVTPVAEETTSGASFSRSATDKQATESPHMTPMQNPTPVTATNAMAPVQSGRQKERLQLQVPQHVGGPVHLVTPTLMVNGEVTPPPAVEAFPDRTANRVVMDHQHHMPLSTVQEHPPPNVLTSLSPYSPRSLGLAPNLSHDALKRSLAAELLRADISGRKRLRGSEAKELAESLLGRMKTPQSQEKSEDGMWRIQCASVLGLAGQLLAGPVGGGGLASSTKKIVARRFRRGSDGYDSPIDDDDDEPDDGVTVRETYDVSWNVMLGGLSGEFQAKGLVLEGAGVADEADDEDPASRLTRGPGEVDDLKRRLERSEERLRRKDKEVQRLRDKVLDAVL